jgi:hypothetical protein
MTTPFLHNRTIKTRLAKVARQRRDLQLVFDRETRRMGAEVADIQARCAHLITDDRWVKRRGRKALEYYCQICGYASVNLVEADPDRAREVQTMQSLPRGS